MARDARGGRPASHRPRVQSAALAVAGVFLLIGVLGFIPGITTDYGELRFAGHHSDALLLGLFQVSILHNAVHLLFGLAGLVLARSVGGARLFLAGGGAIYLALWLYGLAIEAVDPEAGANILPINDADNWLHLALGFGMLALGLLLSNQAGTGGRLDNPADRH
ncbi:DUF4383 domain-containing protein [Micromonospora parathelypteridis]|uniref:DUF4383 domain-containing protein n=1 Tax=Micromonospora parathelypteridis TaxID=1839617 RepID=A0A840VSR9_9ACTN|nr:DUF4383 domain-containing protein [Micromonospora parathelypteridis]MBB5477024.1 hypothetical protein [Micromonospora parathelypteridis]GGO18154.1 membrane protein [Micromonospora parathelypteridis]